MPAQTLIKKVSGKSISVLKTHVSTRQLKIPKDGGDESANGTQQLLKRKQSLWHSDGNPFAFDKEQMEEVILFLTTNNFQDAENLVEFSFKDKIFVTLERVEPNISLLEVKGSKHHIETDEAKEHLADVSLGTEIVTSENDNSRDSNKILEIMKVDDEESGDEADDEENKDTKLNTNDNNKIIGSVKNKKLMNQFNFCERATITYEHSLKEQGTKTRPPLRTTFADNVSQWIIYDTYQEDAENQEKEREKKGKISTETKKTDLRKKTLKYQNDLMNTNAAKKALILERMINQNMFSDVFHDFRYYEDPSDEYRNNAGTLLPLWKFQFNNSKKITVTDIKWNPNYFDLFVVSFGCFDFQKEPSEGCFCLWSLKNPTTPEYICYTTNSVMTLAFHSKKAYLIAIGLCDGIIAVYDFRRSEKFPIYKSNRVDNKHVGIVWQIQWGKDLPEGEFTFYSISSDGYVSNWILMQNRLIQTSVISIFPAPNANSIKYKAKQLIRETGTCIALHPTDYTIFLVGTEEGYIYKCSTAYLSMYLFIYEAHHMPIYCLDYNKYSTNLFVSCSADWTIKVWEDERKEPLFIFDLASSVEDVKWAPYSSTVLVAISLDCKAYVFDLNVDKYKPICVQIISSKKAQSLTKVEFNWKLPIIVIGNDRNSVSLFKLSPNLRVKPKLTKKQQGIDLKEIELLKLNKLLSLIREPSEIKNFNITSVTDASSI